MLCVCGSKRSYCEYGVEKCWICGEKQEAQSQLIDLPLWGSVFVVTPYFYGLTLREAQEYKHRGIHYAGKY